MPGVARVAALRSVTSVLLVSVVVCSRQAAAQRLHVTSARVTPTVLHWTGPDSGKVLLMVEIADLPSAVRPVHARDQVQVADDAGRFYAPMGIAHATPPGGSALIPEYLQAPSVRRAPPRYLYLVPPGTTRFVLHVPARSPVPFSASVAAGVFRQ